MLSALQPYLDNNVLLKAAVVDTGIQWIGFFFSWLLSSEKFYDLAGSSTFLYLTWATLIWAKKTSPSSQWSRRQLLQNSCVSVWAIRLGIYLFSRVMGAGEDRRFRNAKKNPALLFIYWTLQAAWVWISLWPTMIINTRDVDKPLSYRDYIGYGLFVMGFLTEMIADYQKKSFRAITENQGKFISSGLWSLSRHPNYLGEILLWVGLFLPASSVLRGNQWFSVLSPLFITYLLTRVSGIPILEKYADKKWGGVEAYQRYKASTACLIPYLW